MPFLFLYSPRVGNDGHAWVLSPDERGHSEAELRDLSSEARDPQARWKHVIAVSHTVTQTVVAENSIRSGPELLVCAGAFPQSSADSEAIREVLDTLWSSEVTEADLHQDMLHGRLSFIYDAPFMKRIADEFYAHDKVRNTRWKVSAWKPDERMTDGNAISTTPWAGQVLKQIKDIALIMKLLFLAVLVVIGAIVIGKAYDGPKGDHAATSNPTIDSSRKWEFLTDTDWLRVMQATGGREIAAELPGWFQNLPADGAHQTDSSGERYGNSKARKQNDKTSKIPSPEELDRISTWAKRFSEEFLLGDAPNPEVLKDTKLAGYLRMAKDTNDTSNVGEWITNHNEQMKYCPREYREAAKALGEFSKVVQKTPEQTPKLFRDIWKSLETFSKTVGDDPLKFKKFIDDELKKIGSQPPGGYETLTLKDAQRLRAIKEILGSKEFGVVVNSNAVPFGKDLSDWNLIKMSIKDGCAIVRELRPYEPRKVLLLALGKSFGVYQ